MYKGADGRIHSVTKYSPLYIAAYNGRRDIVDILLKKFPKLINVLTVEKWSPLHAAVINGHVSTLDLLLRFSYPKECLKTIRDKKGKKWKYNHWIKDWCKKSVKIGTKIVFNKKLFEFAQTSKKNLIRYLVRMLTVDISGDVKLRST